MPASGLRLRERALKALGRREHTRQELRVKLGEFAESVEQLDSLLDDLERRGWLSEARFVEQLTLRRRSRFGAARILHEMREKGVSEAGVEAAQPRLRNSEAQAARAVWQKKFGNPPASLQEKAKQARFLAGRGFSPEAVNAVLKSLREK